MVLIDLLQDSLPECGFETSLRRMERWVVGIAEGVVPDNNRQLSLQVQFKPAFHRQQLTEKYKLSHKWCVLGIICIIWHSSIGKCSWICRRKRKAKFNKLCNLVSVWRYILIFLCWMRSTTFVTLCIMFFTQAHRNLMRLAWNRWEVLRELRMKKRMLDFSLELKKTKALQ